MGQPPSGFPDFQPRMSSTSRSLSNHLTWADELAEPLLAAGYPRPSIITQDESTDAAAPSAATTTTDSRSVSQARASPGGSRSPTNVHLRVHGWPNHQFAPLLRRLAGGQLGEEKTI